MLSLIPVASVAIWLHVELVVQTCLHAELWPCLWPEYRLHGCSSARAAHWCYPAGLRGIWSKHLLSMAYDGREA